MLTLMLPATDDFEAVELLFEHSLVSLSKWESIHEKPFFNETAQTIDETISYVIQMLRSDFPPEILAKRLTDDHLVRVQLYINSKQTATFFSEKPSKPNARQIITNELIYSWMIAFKIPFQPCEDWHLARLMTLIRVRGNQTTEPKKMSRQEQAEEYRRLNAERRAKLGTTG